MVHQALELVNDGHQPASKRVRLIGREITGPPGGTVRQIGLADSRLALLGRAIRWIRGHYDETLRVEEARGTRDDERLVFPPPLPCGDVDDADPVSEADPIARGSDAARRQA